MPDRWAKLNGRIVRCQRCPRLRAYCRQVAERKRAAYRGWDYWGRPVPNFGDAEGRLLIVGLAPAAHGANRTGRMFTGDRSGDFLYEALHAAGLASRPTSRSRDDGLELRGIAITAALHCAPPGNKPNRDELENCAEWLERTAGAMKNLRGLIALGAIGFEACIGLHRRLGWAAMRPKPKFGHDVLVAPAGAPFLLASYHPSQQNTFTGKLTQRMLRRVLRRARELAGM